MPPFVVTTTSTRAASTRSSARSTRRSFRRCASCPAFAGYFLIEADSGILSSISLFETPAQADESTKLVKNWISDENFGKAIPNAPKITSGRVLAHSKGVPALV